MYEPVSAHLFLSMCSTNPGLIHNEATLSLHSLRAMSMLHVLKKNPSISDVKWRCGGGTGRGPLLSWQTWSSPTWRSADTFHPTVIQSLPASHFLGGYAWWKLNKCWTRLKCCEGDSLVGTCARRECADCSWENCVQISCKSHRNLASWVYLKYGTLLFSYLLVFFKSSIPFPILSGGLVWICVFCWHLRYQGSS
jgi:hypothetical protein